MIRTAVCFALLAVAMCVPGVSVVNAADVCESGDIQTPMPGFVLELFDGKTGTVRVASCDFAAPAVKRAGGWTRIVWKGHPRLGIGFTATAEGVMKDGAMEWTFACSGNASGLPLGRIAFPIVDVPCADAGYLLHSPYAGGGTMGWKKRVSWKDLACGASVCSTLSPGFRFVAVLNGEGRDSIYLDMIGCNAYGPCFNPAHRHPKGGGTHMTDDFRAYLKGVKAAFPGVLLSTEDCGEAYADVFDSHISTHSSYERHGWIGTAPDMEFVPVFQAIWHGAVAVFGNYAIVDNVPYWDPRRFCQANAVL